MERAKDFWLRGGWKEELARWRRHMGPPPYWRQPLEYETPPETLTYTETVWDAEHVGRVILLGLFAAIGILTPMAYINVIVFAYPGGMVGLTAEFLGQVCRATGNCDFGYLMAGLAFGLQILLVSIALIVIGVVGGHRQETSTYTEDEDDTWEHGQIDDRIVALRDDLVKAGVLKAEPFEDEWEAPF